jgi:hypothetical protein
LGAGWREPGNLPVVYLVTQDGIWGTGSDDVSLIQSTKAPKGFDHAVGERVRSGLLDGARAGDRYVEHLGFRVLGLGFRE